MPKERSVVGDLINFRGLVYSPVNEQGVVYLFSKVAEDLNMYVEEVRTAFPDCIARRFDGRGWEKVYIEFEFASANFVAHGHDAEECDMIVCWEHDWPDCPLEVLELREEIKGLPERDVIRPVTKTGDEEAIRQEIEALFNRRGTSVTVRSLYRSLEKQVLAIDNSIWRKVTENGFTVYSPKRVFAYISPQLNRIRIQLFTRGQRIDGVEPLGYESGGFKWGRIYVRNEDEISCVVEALRESWRLILDALERNEPTGWYAEIEDEDIEEEDDVPAVEIESCSETDEEAGADNHFTTAEPDESQIAAGPPGAPS